MSVNLIDHFNSLGTTTHARSLELLKFGADQKVVIPFTADAESVNLHYCQEPDVGGYVHCNGTGCVLCRVGKAKVVRNLLPVYLPTEHRVGVIPLSLELKPGSLYPQIIPALKSDKPIALFIAKADRFNYTVATAEPSAGTDTGERAVKEFLDRRKAGGIDLPAVYPRFENTVLASVPGIREALELKGVA